MSDLVLVSTADLELAGKLRTGFLDAGYRVELVTPGEDVSDRSEAVLLILTGALDDDGSRTLAQQADERLHAPVFGVVSSRGPEWRELARSLALEEVFLPPPDADEILLVGQTTVKRRHLQSVTGIVGETDEIREALERVVQIAPVQSTVLLTGESGTGKELVARGIHALSPRKHKPFIAVNVAALPDTLLESELFGHEKGAFTGAIDSRKGLFELAHGGTIFLDEIGEMPLATQTKLLRVLETREFLRVGGEEPIHVDVRVIAATNQDLKRLVTIGDFRRDLYYRLNVLHIELPPLRERSADIPLLIDAFVREISRRHERPFVGISDEAIRILEDYHWPGNVRELRNLIESMVVLAPGREIEASDIPDEVRRPEAAGALLPVPTRQAPPPPTESRQGTLRPELEFIFRTLVDLRVDMDDLKREFEAYRNEQRSMADVGRRLPVPHRGHPERYEREISVDEIPDAEIASPSEEGNGLGPGSEDDEGEVTVLGPGMTMEDLERQAIAQALREVDGNRRKAAQRLGIGERTLYRKIDKFGLE